MSREVNQRELSEIFDVSHQTMARWSAEGMPVLARGANGQENAYSVRAVIDWYVARETKKAENETQRDRLTRLQADALERDNAIADRRVVPAEQIEPIWYGRVFAAAAFLHGQRSRLAALLEAAPGVEAKRAVLGTEFTAFLTKLGVDGERMQADVGHFLEKLSAKDAADLLARFAVKPNDDKQNAAGPDQQGLGGVRPDA